MRNLTVISLFPSAAVKLLPLLDWKISARRDGACRAFTLVSTAGGGIFAVLTRQAIG